MNKFIHAIILALFGISCWFVWAILTLSMHIGGDGHVLPGFTRLCLGLRPVLSVLPVLAAAYCVYVWARKNDGRLPWIGFFAAATGALVLVMLPAFIAVYLPLLDSINRLASK